MWAATTRFVPHVLYQYGFFVLWFCFIFGITFSRTGLIRLIIGYISTCLCFRNSNDILFRKISLREMEYLQYIKHKNKDLHREVKDLINCQSLLHPSTFPSQGKGLLQKIDWIRWNRVHQKVFLFNVIAKDFVKVCSFRQLSSAVHRITCLIPTEVPEIKTAINRQNFWSLIIECENGLNLNIYETESILWRLNLFPKLVSGYPFLQLLKTSENQWKVEVEVESC